MVSLYAQSALPSPAAIFDDRHVLHLNTTAHHIRLQHFNACDLLWASHAALLYTRIRLSSNNMFNWFRRSKPPSTAQAEDDHPPQIRKPQHAYRDARMSIPIGEREFYDIIQARKRSSLASSVEGGKWKGKDRLNSSQYSLSYAIVMDTVAVSIEIYACLLTIV